MKESRRIFYLILVLAIAVSGCAKEVPQPQPEEEIVLLDPVNISTGWEVAACRNLYNAKVYSATVIPYTEEYSFPESVTLDRWCAYPGESVKKNGALAYADNSSMEERIETMEEQIQKTEESFEEYKKQTLESLEEPEEELKRLEQILENLEDQEPEEFIMVKVPASGGSSTPDGAKTGEGTAEGTAGTEQFIKQENPEHQQWAEMYHRYEGDYRILAHSIDTTKVQLEQRTRLYELDHAHTLRQLEKVKNNLKQGILQSSIEGNVVAFQLYKEKGTNFKALENIIAVGDTQHKQVRCQYINKATAARAKDIYAIIDGKRYEVVYNPIDAEEYARLTNMGERVYTTFELEEAGEEVSVGDFAVITVVNDMRENVLSIPKSTIHKDADGWFVYRKEGEGSVAVSVELGMSDGVYTEILSGLKEGDLIQTEETAAPGANRALVEKGGLHSNFVDSGFLYYPSSSMVCGDITYGTVYFVEYLKSQYEHVDKGEVIAKIRVQPDEIDLERKELKLARLKERLMALVMGEEDVSDAVIDARREEIIDLQEQIDEMKADYATTEIRADKSGVILGMHDYKPGDVLGGKAEFLSIADENTCYVQIWDTNQQLPYGNEVTVSYMDKEGVNRTVQGMAATQSEIGVRNNLKSDWCLILLPPEEVGSMSAVGASEVQNGLMWMRNSFKVEAVIREMNDVCLVPKAAVWEKEGQTYVYVAEPDGSIVARSFIAGGYDGFNYWVVYGLTEGTEVCVK